jgi:tetratricopeptide (TPR) repeat protein
VSQSDFVSRGQALVAAGQFQEAVKVCRLGLLGRPTTVEGRVVLGQALLALKRFDEVLAEMRVALELDHGSIPAQVLKGEALLRKGDTAAAVETLHAARREAPGDPRIMQLLGEAEHVSMHKSAAHPAAAFIGQDGTKNYPQRAPSEGMEDSGPEGYTRPTALQAPASIRRSSQRQAAQPEPTPSPDMLAVGDKSGTVEVDPELEGVELDDQDDFDELAAPPPAKNATGMQPGSRYSVKTGASEGRTVMGKKPSRPTPTMDLDIGDDDVLEMNETNLPRADVKKPGPRSAVRNAVAMPSGPLDAPARPKAGSVPPPRSHAPSGQPPLAQQLAGAPHAMVPLAPTPQPLPPPPIAAALPTMAAAQPPMPFGYQPAMPQPQPQPTPAAMRPTMAIAAPLSPSQQQSAAAVDALFGAEQPQQWNMPDPRSLAAANEPTARPGQQMDPALVALMNPAPQQTPPPVQAAAHKTGMRKSRSKLLLAMWVLIGAIVIGGGVFAGFQIRAMRLQKQIAEARDRATGLAKSDTWSGWTAARDSLSSIVGASATIENRAALARARAVIAYEFGDGTADAKTAVDQLAGKGGFDGTLAQAYLALAQSDAKTAKAAALAALNGHGQDPAALYVSGQATLLGGDTKTATPDLKAAFDKDPRPLYGVALARAYASASAWDEAIATLDKVLKASPDHPAAIIARGMVLAASGRIAPGVALGAEVHTQLEKVIAEGRKAAAEQPHGVSPAQIAFAYLSLAQVDFARGDVQTAGTDVRSAAAIGLDDQRFAEDAIDTLYLIGDLGPARGAAETAMQTWPNARRARIALAEVMLAMGKPADALEILSKQPEAAALPLGQAVRADAKLATGDSDGARADYEGALKKLPNLERAIVGRAWLDIADGNLDEAKKRVEARYSDKGSSVALTTVYAAVLRRTGDRDKAKALLEKVVQGPPSADLARAQLELARVYRDLGDLRSARSAYGEASKDGNFEARFEAALVSLDDRDPAGAHQTLDALVKEAGDHPPPDLLLEAARARILDGDPTGGTTLLDEAEKLPGVARWKLQRERGRLALRRAAYADAVTALSHALDASGDDPDTFLLAADAAGADAAGTLADKIRKLVPERLKDKPEAKIVEGKLAIAANKLPDASTALKAAKEALLAEKATPRRLAQADYGLAYIAFANHNTADAATAFELVITEDPSLADAYLFAANIETDKKKAYELVQKATHYNPESAPAWLEVGKRAAQMRDKKMLADAIGRLQSIAPQGDELKQLQALR